MATTQEVLNNHLKCFGEGDLEGILSDYAPGAILFTPDGSLTGREQIGSLFTAMLAEFAKPGATFSLRQQFVDGDYAFILWTAETACYRHVLCTRRQDHGSVIRGQDDCQELKDTLPAAGAR